MTRVNDKVLHIERIDVDDGEHVVGHREQDLNSHY